MNDIVLNMKLRAARATDGFVIGEIDGRAILREHAAVYAHDIVRLHLIAQYGDTPVDRHPALLNQRVRHSPRAIPLLGKIFVDPAHAIGHPWLAPAEPSSTQMDSRQTARHS